LYKAGERQLKVDGDPKKNGAWTLSQNTWRAMQTAISQNVSVRRYVLVRNFEHSHGYTHDGEKGKPLSAFEYARDLDIANDGIGIVSFLKQIIGDKEYEIEYTQEYLEQTVQEPH
jgi:putative ATP-dependent endonuclease of OLD family